MPVEELFYRFGAALAIGVLVGIERERVQKQEKRKLFAGVRTFAFMGVLGCLAAYVSDLLAAPQLLGIVLVVLGGLMAVSYFFSAREGLVGMTTEVSALVTVLVGALCYRGALPLAVALGVVSMGLLSLKTEIHRIAYSMTQEDIYAILKFAIITAIVLPVLPNQPIGPPPFDVLNPYQIWLIVVLISGVSFLGYILMKVVGPKLGIGLTGVLGGLASSTAVTVSLIERSRSKKAEHIGRHLALAIMLAWTIMFVRVLVVVGVVNFQLSIPLLLPMLAPLVVGAIYSAYLALSDQGGIKENVSFHNPFELGPAFRFGVFYVVALVVARSAQIYLGEIGIYLSSAIAGLTGADAIALSMAQLNLAAGGIAANVAVRAIVLACTANTLAKEVIVILSGTSDIRKAVTPGAIIMLAVGIVVVFFV